MPRRHLRLLLLAGLADAGANDSASAIPVSRIENLARSRPAELREALADLQTLGLVAEEGGALYLTGAGQRATGETRPPLAGTLTLADRARDLLRTAEPTPH